MTRSSMSVIALVLVSAGCRGEPPRQSSSTTAASSTVTATSAIAGSQASVGSISPDSLRDEFVEHGLLVPADQRPAAFALLGRPDSTRSLAVQDSADPTKPDSNTVHYYPGLTLVYYVVGKSGTAFPLSVYVTDNRYLKYPEIGVGASAMAIISALGKPWKNDRADESYSYDCGKCIGAEHPVYFRLEDGRVKSVEYTFYFDY